MKRFLEWFREWVKYVTEDIWHMPIGELPKRKSFLIREIRIIVLAFKGFNEDKIQLRASALTFNTLLSLVPVLALAFGIAQGFGFDRKLEAEIIKNFQGHETVMIYILDLVRNFFDNIEKGVMAGVGLVILIWSVMQVLSHIEKSFNHIWQIKKSRPWGRKFADYLSIMIFAPVFLLLSGSSTVLITTMVQSASEKVHLIASFEPAIKLLLRFTPFIIMWIVFTLLYLIMPNTQVKFRSALVAGIIAGTAFQALQILYIDFQIKVTTFNAIYGSFAAFPLFIVWMQFSWLIVLLGAELSFANQNVQKYEFELASLKVSQSQRRILMLMILNIVIKRFREGEPALSASEISRIIQVPVRLSREILYSLSESGILTEVNIENNRERIYQPGMDPARLTVHFVLSRLDNEGSGDIPVLRNAAFKKIDSIVASFSSKIEESDGNVLIGDI